ncbi:MAG: GSCFA domain-containing protein [Hyphomicrobiaceae bacterium]|nr:GSCFA domain-containing protein [Hyphomicrobiaceae bacterium]
MPKKMLFDEDTSFFAIGSCFAVEIKRRLADRKKAVYPNFIGLPIDVERHVVGALPDEDSSAYYTTHSIRQEIVRALDGVFYADDDFWRIEQPEKHAFAKRLACDAVYQDPYRRDVYGATLSDLREISEAIGRSVRHGLDAADVVIITLGLTEAWQCNSNGLWICRSPTRSDDPLWDRITFNPSGFAENYANIEATIERILQSYPTKRIVLTVSPVPLGKTYTDEDIVVANAYSKSTLRSVAGALCRKYANRVAYWPSYEFALSHDVFELDGRHVQPAIVDYIAASFLNAPDHPSPAGADATGDPLAAATIAPRQDLDAPATKPEASDGVKTVVLVTDDAVVARRLQSAIEATQGRLFRTRLIVLRLSDAGAVAEIETKRVTLVHFLSRSAFDKFLHALANGPAARTTQAALVRRLARQQATQNWTVVSPSVSGGTPLNDAENLWINVLLVPPSETQQPSANEIVCHEMLLFGQPHETNGAIHIDEREISRVIQLSQRQAGTKYHRTRLKALETAARD